MSKVYILMPNDRDSWEPLMVTTDLDEAKRYVDNPPPEDAYLDPFIMEYELGVWGVGEVTLDKIMITKAPDDPEQKKEWVAGLVRLQIAMWVDDGAACIVCKEQFKSVDDFIARDVRATGKDWPDMFCDDACWEKYASS